MAKITLHKNIKRRCLHKTAVRKMARLRKKMLLEELESVLRPFAGKGNFRLPPGIALLPQYKRARRFVEAGIKQIPGPIDFNPGIWEGNPYLNAFCLDSKSVKATLAADRNLKTHFANAGQNQAYGLLTMAMSTRTVFTTRKEGDIIRRDVPGKSVSFDDPVFRALGADPASCKTALRHLLMTELVRTATDKLQQLSDWRDELAAQNASLALGMTGGNPENPPAAPGQPETRYEAMAEMRKKLAEKIKSIDKTVDAPDARRLLVARILDDPGRHIAMKNKQLRLNDLNMIVSDPASTEPFQTIDLTEITLGKQTRWAAVWVYVNRSFFN